MGGYNYIYPDCEYRPKQFIMFPSALLKNEEFRQLTITARILYAILLDLVLFAAKKNITDDEGLSYATYKQKDIAADFNCSEYNARKYLTELERFGLIQRFKVGLTKPDRIRVFDYANRYTHE